MDDLLIKYLMGEASSEEKARVERWLAEDSANRVRHEQFKAVLTIGQRTAASAPRDTGAAWQQLKQKLRQRGIRAAGSARLGHMGVGRMRVGVGRMAAAAVGFLLLGAGLYFVLTPHRQVKAPVAKALPPEVPLRRMPSSSSGNEQSFNADDVSRADTLPDRSVATLNRRSSLRVSGAAERGLSVRLQGEAFFRIVDHPSQPFVVEVNDVTIKVLGTSFEVKGKGAVAGQTGAAGESVSTEVAVETGAVRVCRGMDSLILRAGERIKISGKNRWQKEPNRDKLYGYYLGRPLACDSVPLRTLVEVLNEAYGAHLVIGKKELGDLPLTTVFRHEPLDRILAVLAMTFDLSVVRQGRTIILQ
jgi:transmembrane sensor